MRGLCRLLAIFALLVAASSAFAQQPVLTQFRPDLRVYPQYFAMAQSTQGDLYLGGTDGLARFDGGRWRWYPLPKPGAVRALLVDGSGRLWVGGSNSFDYMRQSDTGEESYVDVSGGFAKQLKTRQFADIWRIAELGGEIYFEGLHDLFVVDSSGAARGYWHHPGRFGAMAVIGEDLWLQWRGEGLKRRVGTDFEMVPGGERFARDLVYNLIPLDRGRALVHDIAPSLSIWDDGRFAPVTLAEPSPDLELDTLGLATRLRDGDIAFAGFDGRLSVLDLDLARLTQIGIGKNFLADVLQARDGSLLVLDSTGISRMEWPQRWRMFGAEAGVETGIYHVAEIGTSIFLATAGGAIAARISSVREPETFAALLTADHEVWAVSAHGSQLLVAGARSLSMVEQGKMRAVSADDLYPRLLRADTLDRERLWIGTEHGPALFEQTASGYRQLQRDFRLGWLINSLIEFDSAIWVGSDTEGLQRLRRADLDRGDFRFAPLPADSGLPAAANQSALVSVLDAHLLVSTHDGLFRHVDGGFRREALGGLSELMAEGEIVAFRQAEDGSAWAYSFHSVYRRGESGRWQLSLLGGTHTGAVLDLLPVAQGEAFVGSENGLLQYREHAAAALAVAAVVPRVTSARVIRSRGKAEAITLYATPQLLLDGGSLEVDFGFPVFEGVGANDFQFRLAGHSASWSEWSTRASATFLALPAGDYRLQLRARRRFGAAVEGEVFEFDVVPRWYEHVWVIPLAIVLVGSLLARALIERQRNKVSRLRVQNAELDRMVRDRTRALESANVQLRGLAESDGLTGLANRRHFDQVLTEALQRAYESRQSLALLMLDVDHFKRFNDNHGHQAGDDVLRAVATQMRDAVRSGTLVARYGGEEFAVIVPACELPRAHEIAERIRAKVATRLTGVTVSIGIAVRAPESLTNADDLVAEADAALYRAKHNGRDRVESAPVVTG